MKQAYLECGKIINTHGFRGDVKLECWCDAPEILADLACVYLREGETYLPRRVTRASVFRQFVIAHLEGVEDEDAANALRGRVLFAAREDIPLPEGGSFIVDLLGLPVRHADTGETLGTMANVETRGGCEMYLVRTATGEYYVPAVPAFIERVDVEDAVYIRPIPGLLGDGEEVR